MPTDEIIPNADEHYEADPPSLAEDEHDREVAALIFAFNHVILPDANVVSELDLLLADVAKRKSKLQLDDDDADELLEAIEVACRVLTSRPEVAALPHFERGMTGAIYAVQSWSMSATQRRLRPVTERMDHGAYLKMLRNDLYTAHLLDCIRERHVERFPLAVAQPNTGFDRVDVLRSDLSENCGTRAAATPSRDMFSTEIHHNDSTSKTPSQARAARCLPKDFPAC